MPDMAAVHAWIFGGLTAVVIINSGLQSQGLSLCDLTYGYGCDETVDGYKSIFDQKPQASFHDRVPPSPIEYTQPTPEVSITWGENDTQNKDLFPSSSDNTFHQLQETRHNFYHNTLPDRPLSSPFVIPPILVIIAVILFIKIPFLRFNRMRQDMMFWNRKFEIVREQALQLLGLVKRLKDDSSALSSQVAVQDLILTEQEIQLLHVQAYESEATVNLIGNPHFETLTEHVYRVIDEGLAGDWALEQISNLQRQKQQLVEQIDKSQNEAQETVRKLEEQASRSEKQHKEKIDWHDKREQELERVRDEALSLERKKTQECTNLKALNASRKDEIEELNDEVATLQIRSDQLDSHQKTIEKLRNEAKDHKRQTERINNLEKQRQSYLEDGVEFRGKSSRLEQELAMYKEETEQEKAGIRAELVTAREKSTHLERELAASKEEAKKEKASTCTEFATVRTQSKLLKEELANSRQKAKKERRGHSNEVARLKSQIKTTPSENSLQDYQRKVEESEKRLEEMKETGQAVLHDERIKHENSLQGYQQEVEESEKRLREMKEAGQAALDEERMKVEESEKRLGEMKEAGQAALHEESTKHEAELQKVRRDMGTLFKTTLAEQGGTQAEVVAATLAQRQAQHQLEELKRNLTSAAAAYRELQQQHGQSQAEVKTLHEKVEYFDKVDKPQAEQMYAGLLKQAEALKQEKDSLARAIENARVQAGQSQLMKQNIAYFSDQATMQQDKNTELQKIVKRYRRERDEARKHIQTLEKSGPQPQHPSEQPSARETPTLSIDKPVDSNFTTPRVVKTPKLKRPPNVTSPSKLQVTITGNDEESESESSEEMGTIWEDVDLHKRAQFVPPTNLGSSPVEPRRPAPNAHPTDPNFHPRAPRRAAPPKPAMTPEAAAAQQDLMDYSRVIADRKSAQGAEAKAKREAEKEARAARPAASLAPAMTLEAAASVAEAGAWLRDSRMEDAEKTGEAEEAQAKEKAEKEAKEEEKAKEKAQKEANEEAQKYANRPMHSGAPPPEQEAASIAGVEWQREAGVEDYQQRAEFWAKKDEEKKEKKARKAAERQRREQKKKEERDALSAIGLLQWAGDTQDTQDAFDEEFGPGE